MHLIKSIIELETKEPGSFKLETHKTLIDQQLKQKYKAQEKQVNLWSTLPLIEAIIELSESYLYGEIRSIFDGPV